VNAKRPKFAVIIPDGAADEPLDELGGRTPLQAAEIPHLDRLARGGRAGLVRTIPEDAAQPGSDIAALSILGYDPIRYYTGRAPLEAASLGVRLDAGDVAFRCNLVTVEGDTLADYSAGEISTDEARVLIQLVNEKLGGSRIHFFPGVSYRHLMVWRDASDEVRTVPPHDFMDQPIEPNLPQGEGEKRLRQLTWDSREILEEHEINRRRRDAGLAPANMIWLWGQGRDPNLPSFAVKYQVTGAVIGAVDLIRGIARCAGLAAPQVAGATGNLQTDFAAKGRAAVEALEQYDFVLCHVEAPDEAAHHGEIEKKIWAIEQVDRHVVGPVLEALQGRPDYRLLTLPDHPTPIAVRTHTRAPVPFVIFGSDISPRGADEFSEPAAAATGFVIDEGHRLMDEFLAPV